ncbi:MAG: MATE family efflux transporter [Bacteroidales bacterium]|nr:MATE family efflux transporter [Bacteroidales bacterium]
MNRINQEILRLSIPAIVSNITTPLLGLVDTAITGHMGAASYIGAIAVGGSMFSLAYWLMNFLRMGTSGLTSQAYGAQIAGHAADAPKLILWRALLVGIALSAALIVLSPWIADALLYFMDAQPDTSAMARTYFLIVIFGAPAVLCTYSLTGWLLGMQDSRAPMWMALVTNVANIAASLILVYGFGLKIEGVAIGTLSAQWIGLGCGLWLAHRRYRPFAGAMQATWTQLRRGMRRFFSLNTDIFLRTLCLVAVTLWFTRSGARSGSDILAANALLMQLFILFSYFMDGFAFAGEAMAGKYFGQGNRPMLSATIRGIFQWSLGVVILFTLLYGLGGRLILELLTDDPAVVDTAMSYLPWAIAVPAAGVMAFVWDGIFIGLTLSRQMLLSMLCASAVYFLLYFLLTPTLSNHGLWLSFISYLLTRGLIQSLLYPKK